jgi:hypothetical protein
LGIGLGFRVGVRVGVRVGNRGCVVMCCVGMCCVVLCCGVAWCGVMCVMLSRCGVCYFYYMRKVEGQGQSQV